MGESVHREFMREALAEAEEAARTGEVPVGAVIVSRGEIIARAHNRTVELADPTAHAEMLAIRAALADLGDSSDLNRLEECSLYVTLEPCPMCAGAIVLARLRALMFGAHDSKAGAAETLWGITTDRRLNHQTLTRGGILDDEARALLRAFFESRR